MATPSQARSVVALFMGAGAVPEEIDGAVQVLIELQKQRTLPPMSYGDVAREVVEALSEYRKRNSVMADQS